MPGVMLSSGRNILLPCDDNTGLPYTDGRGATGLEEIIERGRQQERSRREIFTPQAPPTAEEQMYSEELSRVERLSNEERVANLRRMAGITEEMQGAEWQAVGETAPVATPKKKRKRRRKKRGQVATLPQEPYVQSISIVRKISNPEAPKWRNEQMSLFDRGNCDDNLP